MADRNLLFFVHGIGRQSDGWIDAPDGPVPALEQAMGLYECFAPGMKLRDVADVVEVRYDDIFDEQIQRWTDQVKGLPPVGPGADWVGKLQEFWTKANGDGKTFTDFGGDVILYRGFDLIARSVRLRVNRILLAEIYKRHVESLASGKRAPEITVVAHSMGTAVTYDSLYSLFTGSWFAQGDEVLAHAKMTDEQKTNFAAALKDIESPAGTAVPVRLNALMMVSNTSSLLSRWDAARVNAILKPGAATRFFYNVNHTLDPVGKVKPFQIPSDWNKSRARNVSVSHLHQENIHALSHYLANPAVHGRLFGALLGEEKGFTQACFDRAMDLATTPEWTGVGGALAAKAGDEVAKLRKKLEEIAGAVGQDDVFGLIGKLDAFTRRVIGGAP
jgi:hypothetical protein